MIGLGLTSTELARLHRTLASHHLLKVTLRLFDLDHRELRVLTPYFDDGQVNYSDTDGTTSDRSATLTLFDPRFRTGMDNRNPADRTAGPNRLIAIRYAVRPPNGPWVSIPVFCGPVTAVKRRGWYVQVECLGKEYLARHAMHSTKSWPKGTRKSSIVRDILIRVCGEDPSQVSIPTWPQRTSSALSLGSEDDPWKLAERLAGHCGYRLFYDGRGKARTARKSGSNVLFTFRDGAGGSVLTMPESGPDSFDQLINRVRVTGVKPKKAKKDTPTPVGVAIAPRSHPRSPYRLGRNGVGMAWTLQESDDHADSKKKATKTAKEKLQSKLVTPISASFTSLPVPHLEIGDLCSLQADTVGHRFRFGSASLPLRCSETQTVGLVGRVSK